MLNNYSLPCLEDKVEKSSCKGKRNLCLCSCCSGVLLCWAASSALEASRCSTGAILEPQLSEPILVSAASAVPSGVTGGRGPPPATCLGLPPGCPPCGRSLPSLSVQHALPYLLGSGPGTGVGHLLALLFPARPGSPPL